ncbi:extensin-1-like [Bradysia coprophila]|uniref:extensin-1-like n=1 Tax=Bradysia coprophila TaxID=38358 RepID=UPI00187DC159|nr:extensin-1-like [Bradysia coprophila]
MELLLVILLSGCALSAPIHSIHQRDVSHLSPPSTRYGVPDRRISAPYPPPAPVQEYGPPHHDEPAPVEPSNEYGPPHHDEPAPIEPSHEYGPPANEYLPPPPPPQIPSLPEVVVSHPYPAPADPVQEYGPPAIHQDIVAPTNEYGPPVEAIQDTVVSGPYPPPLFDSRYGAPTH